MADIISIDEEKQKRTMSNLSQYIVSMFGPLKQAEPYLEHHCENAHLPIMILKGQVCRFCGKQIDIGRVIYE